jgi:hypothetical protein
VNFIDTLDPDRSSGTRNASAEVEYVPSDGVPAPFMSVTLENFRIDAIILFGLLLKEA